MPRRRHTAGASVRVQTRRQAWAGGRADATTFRRADSRRLGAALSCTKPGEEEEEEEERCARWMIRARVTYAGGLVGGWVGWCAGWWMGGCERERERAGADDSVLPVCACVLCCTRIMCSCTISSCNSRTYV